MTRFISRRTARRTTGAAATLALTLAMMVAPARAEDCARPDTQADMARCAFAAFEAASAEQAAALRAAGERLPKAQQPALRKVQRAFAAFAAAQCDLEALGSQGGSVQQTVKWRCMARLARDRASALQALAACPEGDAACPARKP